MRGELLPSTNIYDHVVSQNRAIIEGFSTKPERSAYSLYLIDPPATSPTHTLNRGCDELNRTMLNDLYEQIGVDSSNPLMTQETRYASGRTYCVTFYDLGDNNVIRESWITQTNLNGNPHATDERFFVMVGHREALK